MMTDMPKSKKLRGRPGVASSLHRSAASDRFVRSGERQVPSDVEAEKEDDGLSRSTRTGRYSQSRAGGTVARSAITGRSVSSSVAGRTLASSSATRVSRAASVLRVARRDDASSVAQAAVTSSPRLRFRGGRFEQKEGVLGFPLDAIAELQRYQALVLEIAKQKWRADHPGRNLPRRFENRVRLRLTGLGEGSVVTALVPEAATIDLPDAPSFMDKVLTYLEDSLHKISNGVVELPEDASPETVKAFRAIGQGLAADETIEHRPWTVNAFSYGRAEHEALLKAMERDLRTRHGLLIGQLDRLGANRTFTVIDPDGRVIEGGFSTSEVWHTLHALHEVADKADLVWLDATYEIDERDGKVSKINDVHQADLFGRHNDAWSARLAKLSTLQPGWASSGDGEPIDVPVLQLALEVLAHVTEKHLAEPGLYPSPDGGVRLEWLTHTSHAVLSIEDDLHFLATFVDDEQNVFVSEELTGSQGAIGFVDRFIA